MARIDAEGYFVEDVVIRDNQEIPADCIEVRPDTSKRGFFKARWDGKKWVEGLGDEEIQSMKSAQERQNQITHLESLLAERYQAHGKLLATDADPAEIEEVKGEIALILGELEGLYRA